MRSSLQDGHQCHPHLHLSPNKTYCDLLALWLQNVVAPHWRQPKNKVRYLYCRWWHYPSRIIVGLYGVTINYARYCQGSFFDLVYLGKPFLEVLAILPRYIEYCTLVIPGDLAARPEHEIKLGLLPQYSNLLRGKPSLTRARAWLPNHRFKGYMQSCMSGRRVAKRSRP